MYKNASHGDHSLKASCLLRDYGDKCIKKYMVSIGCLLEMCLFILLLTTDTFIYTAAVCEMNQMWGVASISNNNYLLNNAHVNIEMDNDCL